MDDINPDYADVTWYHIALVDLAEAEADGNPGYIRVMELNVAEARDAVIAAIRQGRVVSAMHVSDLPRDLLKDVMSLLPGDDVKNAALTCKTWHAAAIASSPLWSRPPAHTGGASGIPWGTRGVYVEPHDPARFDATLEALRHAARGGRAAPPPAAAASSDDEEEPALPLAPTLTCHPACGQSLACLVDGFHDDVDDLFPLHLANDANVFRHRHRESMNGVDALEAARAPVTTARDVDALRTPAGLALGRLTTARIKALVARRGQADSDVATARRRLRRVWGIGFAKASALVAAGITTVEQARVALHAGTLPPGLVDARVQLGLTHFEDLQTRIPRDEVGRIEADMHRTASDLWNVVYGCDPRTWLVPCCTRALGSYARAQTADVGDVDLLVAPPPDRVDPRGRVEFPKDQAELRVALGEFVDRVRAMTDYRIEGTYAVTPSRDHTVSAAAAEFGFDDTYPELGVQWFEAASFQGVLIPRAGPVRRIDIKMYPRHALAAATLHMTGDKHFWHALKRYGKSSAAAGHAADAHPGANGFHVGDTGIVPLRGERVFGAVQWHTVGGPLQLESEAAAFEMLGLAYVPPHERTLAARG